MRYNEIYDWDKIQSIRIYGLQVYGIGLCGTDPLSMRLISALKFYEAKPPTDLC